MNSSHIDDIKTKITDVFEKYGIKSANLFGSFAKGLNQTDSDIDIFIELPENFGGIFRFIRLENELSESLNQKVDLVSKNSIKDTVKDEIINSSIKIYG